MSGLQFFVIANKSRGGEKPPTIDSNKATYHGLNDARSHDILPGLPVVDKFSSRTWKNNNRILFFCCYPESYRSRCFFWRPSPIHRRSNEKSNFWLDSSKQTFIRQMLAKHVFLFWIMPESSKTRKSYTVGTSGWFCLPTACCWHRIYFVFA